MLQLVDNSRNRTADLGSFTTDAHGSGQPRFTLPDWPDTSCELRIVAQTPGRPETADLGVVLKRSSKVMLSSDKPVYQPGQVIHLRALTLRQPNLHPVAGETATFSVVDPKGNVIFKLLDKTSRYGITAADCPLDSEIAEGAYTVLCKVGDVDSKSTVDVKKYVLPKFKVAVTPDKPFYKPGDTIKLTVQADYFFGKPVADAGVDVNVIEELPGRQPSHLAARTDANGAASLEFAADRPAEVQASDGRTNRWHVWFQAMVTDSAGQKQTATAEPAVSAWPARMEVIPEAGELVAGVPNTVYVLVTRLDGQAAGRADITLNDKQADADDRGAASFEIVPSGADMQLTASALDAAGMEIARRQISLPTGTGR